MSCMKYYNLNTAFFDLGAFMSHFSGLTNLSFNKMFYGHAQPLIIIYEFIYKLFSLNFSPYVILILQSLLLSLPIFVISKMYDAYFSFGYLLIFPIWYNALFDFHFDHLVIILQFLFFYFIKIKSYGKATISSISMVFIKEIFALQTGFSSFYLLIIIIINRKDPIINENIKLYMIYSILLFFIGFGYFYVATNIIIPEFTPSEKNAIEMSKSVAWLGNSVSTIMFNIFTNPLDIIKEIFTNEKDIIHNSCFWRIWFCSFFITFTNYNSYSHIRHKLAFPTS